MSLKLDTVVEQLQAYFQNGYNENNEGQTPFFLIKLKNGEVQTSMLPPPVNSIMKGLYMKMAKRSSNNADVEMIGVAFEAYYRKVTSVEEAQSLLDEGVGENSQECIMLMMQERDKDCYAGIGMIEKVDGIKQIIGWKDFDGCKVGGTMHLNFF